LQCRKEDNEKTSLKKKICSKAVELSECDAMTAADACVLEERTENKDQYH